MSESCKMCDTPITKKLEPINGHQQIRMMQLSYDYDIENHCSFECLENHFSFDQAVAKDD